jgi:hypothetical protein
MRKNLIILLLIIFETNILFGQNECVNKTEIKQLGVEFCLPDNNWTIEEEDGLKFISLHKSTLYFGTKTYSLKMEKLTKDLSVTEYFEKQRADYTNIKDYKENIVLKGIKEINGKPFYYCKTHTIYKSNNIMKNSYAVTYCYSENKIGYSLSLVVSDENIDSWNETETLKIWDSFKIISLPKNSVME